MKKTKINVYYFPYKTAKDIICAFFHDKISKKNTKTKILNIKVTFQDFNSKNKKMTIANAIKIINELKVWGFCVIINSKEKHIHYWYKNKKNIKLIANLLSHEYAHVLYGNSEKMACQCGLAATYAIKFLLDNKLIKTPS